MLYQLYQSHADLMAPLRTFGKFGSAWARMAQAGPLTPPFVRHFGAGCDILAEAGLSHGRPDYGIRHVRTLGQEVAVTEEVLDDTPFGSLLHFKKDTPEPGPRVLLVAPMSGHFATLLRATVATLLRDHDVSITDWKNARDVPLSDGEFGLDNYVDHLIRFMEVLGPDSHMVAVCQPAVAGLIATAVMAEARNRCTPRTLTLMAGPIDTRVNPTKVNELAQSKSIEWFESNLISTVPWRFKGAGRRVYPGFVQLSAFMSMNAGRHFDAHVGQYHALARGDDTKADAHRRFYREYGAVMDLTAEFYLQTVQRVFQDHDLPLGRMTWHGNKVNPSAIRRTWVMTVEGERDDICAIGQTVAALDMVGPGSAGSRRYHLQAGVGHYGVFSGRRWENEVYPKVRAMIQAFS